MLTKAVVQKYLFIITQILSAFLVFTAVIFAFCRDFSGFLITDPKFKSVFITFPHSFRSSQLSLVCIQCIARTKNGIYYFTLFNNVSALEDLLLLDRSDERFALVFVSRGLFLDVEDLSWVLVHRTIPKRIANPYFSN